MADIAERERTSRRTAFNHFSRKSDIPMLWTRRIADIALLEAADPTTAETADQVCDYFRLISRMVEAEPEVSRPMMLSWTAAIGPIRYESQLLVDRRAAHLKRQVGRVDRPVRRGRGGRPHPE